MVNNLPEKTESEIAQRIDEMNEVVRLKLQGYQVHEIMKLTNIRRGRILDHLEEWKKWAKEEQDIAGRAREMLASVDQHYDMIIKELWNVVNQADAAGELGSKNTALKNLASVEKDRHAAFQQAGLDDQSALADQMRETERKQEELVKILREVTGHCNNCRVEVAKRLSSVTGKTEVIKMPGAEDEIVIEDDKD